MPRTEHYITIARVYTLAGLRTRVVYNVRERIMPKLGFKVSDGLTIVLLVDCLWVGTMGRGGGGGVCRVLEIWQPIQALHWRTTERE